jgi:hypothetical protein
MKQLFLLASATLLFSTAASAQWAGEKRKQNDYKNTEQEASKVNDFEINGFARDKDERKIRTKNENDKQLNGFDNNAEEKAEKKSKRMSRADRRTLADRKARADRNRDIEVFMLDLNLAKIQKPIFRGIQAEHGRDVNAIIMNESINNAEKNIQLKQVYALRTKRLQETLTDLQYQKWVRLKDQDEYMKIEKPEDY